MNPSPRRPFVFINMAMTADGKIAPANRNFVPFGSRHDQELLLQLRTRADAVMAGARTVGQGVVTLGPGGEKYRARRRRQGRREYNLRVIVSGSGRINPHAEIFRHRFSPILILTTRRAGTTALRRMQAVADAVKVCGGDKIDFARALRWLRHEWGVRTLLCEGGGELNDALFQAGLVDELNVTVCPLILGGREAPTVCDGKGFARLATAAPLRLLSKRRRGEELYLRFAVERRLARR